MGGQQFFAIWRALVDPPGYGNRAGKQPARMIVGKWRETHRCVHSSCVVPVVSGRVVTQGEYLRCEVRMSAPVSREMAWIPSPLCEIRELAGSEDVQLTNLRSAPCQERSGG